MFNFSIDNATNEKIKRIVEKNEIELFDSGKIGGN